MGARLEVRASDPAAPERAGAELTESLLAMLPRRRAITLAVVGLGPHPGLIATPWLLTGVLGKLVEHEQIPTMPMLLGDAATGETALRKAAQRVPCERACFEWPSVDRSILLRPIGERGEPARIPREVVGTSLVVIAPLLHRRIGVGNRETALGPVAGALAGLARACGLGRSGKLELDRLIAAGHLLTSDLFCGASLLLDATWAGLAEPEPSSRPPAAERATAPITVVPSSELVAPERVLALADLGRSSLPDLLAVDAWSAQQLGLAARTGRARSSAGAPEVVGSLERWPHLSVGPRAPETGLAGRAITGLRKQGSAAKAKVGALIGGPAPRAALTARVPGRFAGEWTRRWYGQGERS